MVSGGTMRKRINDVLSDVLNKEGEE